MALLGTSPVEIDSPDTMFAVLKELAGSPTWRGMVDVWRDTKTGDPVWRIELNSVDGQQVNAGIGDFLVLAYGHLLKLTADQVG